MYNRNAMSEKRLYLHGMSGHVQVQNATRNIGTFAVFRWMLSITLISSETERDFEQDLTFLLLDKLYKKKRKKIKTLFVPSS